MPVSMKVSLLSLPCSSVRRTVDLVNIFRSALTSLWWLLILLALFCCIRLEKKRAVWLTSQGVLSSMRSESEASDYYEDALA